VSATNEIKLLTAATTCNAPSRKCEETRCYLLEGNLTYEAPT